MANNSITDSTFKTIPRNWLLGVYVIVPVLLSFVLLDIFLWDFKFQQYLGIETLFHPVFLFVFLLPHIIASWFGFFDGEYISHYKKHMLIYMPMILILTAVLLYVDIRYGLLFFFVNDVWHGVRQKVGIGLILGAKPGWLHFAWTIVPFITSSLIYVFFIIPEVIPGFIMSALSEALLVGAIVLMCVTAVQMYRHSGIVRWYVLLVSSVFIVGYFFVLAGYVFLAFLAFRFVHDFSAFAFYITHDQNRNRNGYKNLFYKFFSFIPLPYLILTPAAGLLFAYLVRAMANGIVVGQAIVILICMSHFYLESVMWKRDSPHRKCVRIE